MRSKPRFQYKFLHFQQVKGLRLSLEKVYKSFSQAAYEGSIPFARSKSNSVPRQPGFAFNPLSPAMSCDSRRDLNFQPSAVLTTVSS